VPDDRRFLPGDRARLVGQTTGPERVPLSHGALAHDGLAHVAVDLIALTVVLDPRADALDDPGRVDPDHEREAMLHVVLHEPGHHRDVGLVHPRHMDGDDDLAIAWLRVGDLADAPWIAEGLDRERAHSCPSVASEARAMDDGTRRRGVYGVAPCPCQLRGRPIVWPTARRA
jgi:hypothetical protein